MQCSVRRHPALSGYREVTIHLLRQQRELQSVFSRARGFAVRGTADRTMNTAAHAESVFLEDFTPAGHITRNCGAGWPA